MRASIPPAVPAWQREIDAAEAVRASGYGRVLALVAGAAFLLTLTCGGDPRLRSGMLLAASAIVLGGVWVWRSVVRGRYGTFQFRTFGAICGFGSIAIQAYLGVFSPATIAITLGLSYWGASDDRVGAHIVSLSAIGGYAVLATCTAAGLFPDRALVSVGALGASERMYFVPLVLLVYVLSFQQARAAHTATRRAVERLHGTLIALEEAQTERALEVVRDLQRSMIPQAATTRHACFEVCGRHEAARSSGGDWWTCRQLDSGKILVAIGASTCDGLPAALLTAAAMGACAVADPALGHQMDPAALLTLMNRAVGDAGRGEFKMRCFVGILDATTRTLWHASAGHGLPYLVRAAGQGHLEAPVGPLLGAEVEPIYVSSRQPLEVSDLLVLHTAATAWTRNGAGEAFGHARLHALAAAGASTLEGSLQLCFDGLRAFASPAHIASDRCIVLARVRAEPGRDSVYGEGGA